MDLAAQTKNNIFDKEYIMSLVNVNTEDKRIDYIKNKIKRRGVQYLSITELNYIRGLNNLELIDIEELKNILYENMVSYSDIFKNTGISRPMMCMILRGNRNCTINQLQKIYAYLDKLHIKY